MKFKAFTLIELMVVLAIIVIIATASVPQVQVWIARNRGNQAVSQFISDFSKAKSIAAYTVIDSTVNIDGHNVEMGVRPQTAILARKTNYSILQKDSMSGAWSDISDRSIKRVNLPQNVFLERVNDATNSSGSTATIVFTSSGRLKNSANAIIPDIGGSYNCGSVSSPINGKRVVVAIIRSMVTSSNGLWYRIEIAESGEYVVCVSASDTIPVFEDNAEGYLDI